MLHTAYVQIRAVYKCNSFLLFANGRELTKRSSMVKLLRNTDKISVNTLHSEKAFTSSIRARGCLHTFESEDGSQRVGIEAMTLEASGQGNPKSEQQSGGMDG